MTGPYRIAPANDPVVPADGGAIALTVDGETVTGRAGQTVAGVLLASGRVSWRTSPRSGRPRGVFCGIGVCFDCLVVVNGLRDVRACQRRAADGDVITSQDDAGSPPGDPAAPPGDDPAASPEGHLVAFSGGSLTASPHGDLAASHDGPLAASPGGDLAVSPGGDPALPGGDPAASPDGGPVVSRRGEGFGGDADGEPSGGERPGPGGVR